jgi:[CysO sulfur-carrier protein]-S-L-cysteine hydrolase
MVVAPDLLNDVIAHAREEYDAECCGMIACEQDGPADARRAVRVHLATNVFAGDKDAAGNDRGRKRFEIDGREVLRVMSEFEDAGWELGAIYHSHTHTAPYPSQTDINFAAHWPGVEWVIVGLANGDPEVRSYLIEDGEVTEVPLEVR